MIKIIPAVDEKRIVYCDKCEKEVKVPVCLKGKEPREDSSGAIVGYTEIIFDLCLSCFYDVKKTIEG